MADKNVSIQEIKQLANDVDAKDSDSVNKFLSNVDEKFKGLPATERAEKLDLLSSHLEQKGVLPQLLVTAGLGDAYSANYGQMKESNGWDLRKDELESMAKNGKKGFVNVDAAGQFLASAVLRNFDGKAGITNESSHHTFGIADGKIDYKQIKSWATRENTEFSDRRGVEKSLLQWDSVAKKLETDQPKRDDIQALLKADKHTKNTLLTPAEREAAQFMLDKFDTIKSIDNSSFRLGSYDDWISKEKLEYWGKEKLHTSENDAKVKSAAADLLKVRENKEAEAAKVREAAAAAAKTEKPAGENDRIKQLEEQLKKQEELIQKLLKQPVGGGNAEVKPPVKVEVPPVNPEVKPPVKVEVPPVNPEVKPPVKVEVPPVNPEVKPPVKVEVPKPPARDWAKEEEANMKALEQLLNPTTVKPQVPVRR